jgi:hypothetical protein
MSKRQLAVEELEHLELEEDEDVGESAPGTWRPVTRCQA